MPRATTLEELRTMSIEDLINQYDATSENVRVGLEFLRQEIIRRESVAETAAITRMTRQMRNLTVVITVLTIVNIIVAAITLLKG